MTERKLINLEVDGRPVAVPEGSMVMAATNALGVYVPHFCWHRKLSIAANCRMCLVQVEKAPKPLPACATPVAEGMKVFTHSDQAVTAQKGVMEFLLINHPLDCPICDQGGECQLQDLAVGYGPSASRFQEPKRVVPNKNLGPLISTDMTRCIHCTRCVRFGQEIAGVMELGMAGRGEHSEILSFVGKTVDSELSGNMIDLCPVGALTSKPFRYSARTWELARRKSISPHCGLGSNLVLQVKGNRVMRVLPLDNESVNECWISDKDRFSYEALNSSDRLVRPMLRGAGGWTETDWPTALQAVADGLRAVCNANGPDQIATVVSPHSTLEELHLAARLTRGLGSDNVDFRLRHSDTSLDGARAGIPWLGMPIAAIGNLRRVLVVGSNLRKDHPLIAQRLRQAQKQGARIAFIGSFADDPLFPLVANVVAAPSALLSRLVAVRQALEVRASGVASVPSAADPENAAAVSIATWLADGEAAAVLFGNAGQHHAQAAQLEIEAQAIARLAGARFGVLGEAANSVGGFVAGAVPRTGGRAGARLFTDPRKAYVLLHAEPELDGADGAAALAALRQASFVVALSPFAHRATAYAHVMLPIAPFSETGGTFVSTEGRVQSFSGVVQPLGDTRPGWKVLRVLGNLLGLEGFEQQTVDEVRMQALDGATDLSARLDNALSATAGTAAADRVANAIGSAVLERIGDVPIHFADPLARRAPALQKTHDALFPQAWMNGATLAALGLVEGQEVSVRQGTGVAMLFAGRDDRIPARCVRVSGGHPLTAGLGPLTGAVTVESAAAARTVTG